MGRMLTSSAEGAASRHGFRFTSRGMRFSLQRGCRLETYRFPGRWMPDAQLDELRGILKRVARYRLDPLPDYGIFLPDREPFRNRIVTVVFEDDRPVGFSAMVWLPLRVDDEPHDVLHLGLVVTTPNRLSRNLLWQMYYFPVFFVGLHRFLRPFWVSCVSLEPSVIGAVSDGFHTVRPHYQEDRSQDSTRLAIARQIVEGHAHEFGAGEMARLNEETFVIEGSCRGPSETLRASYRGAAKYSKRECNEYCRDLLDYDRGDELLQLGRADVVSGVRLGLSRRFFNGG